MIKTLRIQNFQSHADTEIELSPTVTVFTGESDQGKTAILRAFRKLVRNIPTGDFFIRYGQKDCTITMSVDDKTIVRKVGKKNSINLYKINDDAYNNFGVGIPEEVKRELKIAEVQVFEKEKIDLNIRTQHEGLFLAGGTGVESLRGRIFGKVTGSDIINRAVANLNSTVRVQNKDREDLTAKAGALDVSLLALAYLDELKSILDDIESLSANIVALEKFVQKLGVCRDEMRIVLKTNTLVQNSLSVLNSVNLEDVIAKLDMFNRLNAFKTQIEDTYAHIKSFKNIETLTDDFSLVELALLVDNINVLQDLDDSIQVVEGRLEAAEAVSQIEDFFDLSSKEKASIDLNNFHQLYNQLNTTYKQKKAVEEELNELSDLVVTVEGDLEKCKQELGVCPVCEREF